MTEVEAVARGPQVWLSVKAYHALTEMGLVPNQTELLYGQVFHKMSKSPVHSFLALRLLRLLHAVVLGREEDYRQEHPRTAEVVIEVCVTSHDYDRSKLRAYANAGVKECWFVLAQDNQIEVHRQPAGDQFAERAVHGPGG